jgi:tetratricopeptide (TPR) repeat protein
MHRATHLQACGLLRSILLLLLMVLLALPGTLAMQADSNAEERQYLAASSDPDPAKKIETLERLLRDFPEGKHRVEALETLIGLYYRAENVGQVESAARRLLKIDPSNERAIRALKYVGSKNYQQGFNPEDIRSVADQAGSSKETNDLLRALNTTDDTAKVAALEGFLKTYPASPSAGIALTNLVVAYEKMHDTANAKLTALKLIKTDQNNVVALATLVNFYGNLPEHEADDVALQDYAQRGQKAMTTVRKPPTVSQLEFDNSRKRLNEIFNQALLKVLFRSKTWTPTQIEVVAGNSTFGLVIPASGGAGMYLQAIVAGQHETLHCSYNCSSFQPGVYAAEVKKGEIKIHGSDLRSNKARTTTFRISGTW